MKVIPFGDNLLVRRRKIGDKLSEHIYTADETKDRNTDLADVTYVPDLTFADKEILDNADKIIESLAKQAVETGDKDAVNSLLDFNDFVKRKSIKVGDAVFMSKYVGTDFHESGSNENLTLVHIKDIIGLVVSDG